ncbi:MAG TPA: PEP-CTERM-box response regulator transcription factor [Steroidobacteraceae bacterium]|nr:PEP-CTERM-box response regulator transcription factor [Steroidobacteraceae bacterium]
MPEERPQRILIVEDDPGLQKQLKWCFDGFEVLQATRRDEALAAVRRFEPQVVLQDLGLPPDAEGVSEGLATLQETLRIAPRTKVIVVTGNADRDNALKAVALGAADFFSKPIDTDVLRLMVERALHLSTLETELERLRLAQITASPDGIIATDAGMQRVLRMIEKVAPTNASVLVLGESGTGKELVSRAIHVRSERRDKRFVAINCAAIPEQLLESELFGYERGAFTGAVKQTIGKIETAEGGTLFLDEIGDMPLPLQAKLLRFLQDRIIERVGGRQPIPVDVRVVCATNQDLKELIATQQFRQDLYYRISEVTILLPPLRDRVGDAVVMANAILKRASGDNPRTPRGFTDEALVAIQRHEWPGNVRELENKVRSATIMAAGPLISADDLGFGDNTGQFKMLNLKSVRTSAERQAVVQAISLANGNLSAAAELLGITRPTLYDLIGKLGIKPPSGAAE